MNSSLPLAGKTILVTRAAGQSSQFTKLLHQQGATVLEMPAIEITPPSSWEMLDQAIADLEQFDWLILTSANGVNFFFERLQTLNRTISALQQIKIAVVGQKTAATLARYDLQPDFVPPDFVADSLVAHFPEADRLPELKILFPRVETGGREVLVKELTAKGATVIEVASYQSGCAKSMPSEVAAALETNQIDIITFASSKTVQCVAHLIPQLPVNLCIASIGPQTSASCQQCFGRVDLEAEDYTLEGLTEAIVRWVQNQ